MIKAIVFDFDDTLVSKIEEKKQETFWELFSGNMEAYEAAKKFVRKNVGLPRREMIAGILEVLGGEDIELKNKDTEYYVRKFGEITEAAQISFPAMPGAEELLTKLYQTHALYINTQTSQDSIDRVIVARGWKHFFKEIYGSPPGTKKEHLAEIIKLEGVEPGNVLVVGDGRSDLEEANAFNCPFIGVANDLNSWRNKEFALVSDLSELTDLIQKL